MVKTLGAEVYVADTQVVQSQLTQKIGTINRWKRMKAIVYTEYGSPR